ncbi:MAG: DUF924 domain-containing protein [Gammaproteobacteria bacterium]|nr:DUF924 domain-containing protein [Gammaproteobacteria bacterium]MDH5652581.1 DUF924 domain-containing protein [Gammaproteobacteria bacterium]
MNPMQIIDYWYSDEMRKHWFASTPELDYEIKSNYEKIWESAGAGNLDEWRNTPEGCLALTIILDQMPLNMFRGTARSFATEGKAVEVALFAVENDFDEQISADKLPFLFMPFMHSENLEHQDLSVKLFSKHNLQDSLKFALHHRDIVLKYGRFPHRNKILGRESTKEEMEYLASEDSFKG